MISLAKINCPQILKEKAAEWKASILATLAAGGELTKTQKSRYSHPDIKAALIEETHGKCAYCESKIRHTGFGDIEHIAPKSLNAELWVEWDNLTLACQRCNNAKSELDVQDDNFVDPYTKNPDDHFAWAGPFILPVPGDNPGLLTENELKLNRPELVERRMRHIRKIQKHAEVIARESDPAARNVFLSDFEREFEADKEYAACARAIRAALRI